MGGKWKIGFLVFRVRVKTVFESYGYPILKSSFTFLALYVCLKNFTIVSLQFAVFEHWAGPFPDTISLANFHSLQSEFWKILVNRHTFPEQILVIKLDLQRDLTDPIWNQKNSLYSFARTVMGPYKTNPLAVTQEKLHFRGTQWTIFKTWVANVFPWLMPSIAYDNEFKYCFNRK